jgi:hypothetical protein
MTRTPKIIILLFSAGELVINSQRAIFLLLYVLIETNSETHPLAFYA